MSRFFIYAFLSTIFFASSASACSCFCNDGHTVSEFMQDHKVFWGVPVASHWKNEQSQNDRPHRTHVITHVTVIEGYDRIKSNSSLTVQSRPDDGGSCGKQLNLGVLQLIITTGEKNRVSTCQCAPPLPLIVDYLNNNNDTFIPNPEVCEKPNQPPKTKEICETVSNAWKSERKLQHSEHMKVYRVFRSAQMPD